MAMELILQLHSDSTRLIKTTLCDLQVVEWKTFMLLLQILKKSWKKKAAK